jgi:perosamine synthetase
MDPICEAAEQHGLVVVEDASESLGATYKGSQTGSLGRLGCFSFNGNMILTTGGGGMVTTDDPELARRAKYLTTQAKDDPVEYVHGEVGYNYRLTNVLAALGCAQLEELDAYVARKREIARRYDAELMGLEGLGRLMPAEWAESNEWLYTITVDPDRFGVGSRELLGLLAERGIQSRPLWQPLHQSPAHSGGVRERFDVAERLSRTALSLPCSVGLSEAQQEDVILAVRAAAQQSAS